MKLASLMTLFFIVSACGPKDVKLEHPLLRKSDNALEAEFEHLFSSSESELPLQLPLMLTDQNLEAAKILEFALGIDSEIERLNQEVQREARGERANRSILCRNIQVVSSTETVKRYVVTHGCRSRTGQYSNEVRGQELYELIIAEGKVRSISMETYPGFETRIEKMVGEGNEKIRGTQANLQENRRLQAMMTAEDTFTYSYANFTEYDQKFRPHSRDFKNGYEEKGTIVSNVQGVLGFEVNRGRNTRFFARTLTPTSTSKGNLGDMTIKAERHSVDKSRLPFSKFYILSSSLSQGSEKIALNYNNCGEFVTEFKAESRWITGKSSGKNRFSGSLNMDAKEIVYSEGRRAGKGEAEASDEKKEEAPRPGLRWAGCYGRSQILPLMPRNKFFIQ